MNKRTNWTELNRTRTQNQWKWIFHQNNTIIVWIIRSYKQKCGAYSVHMVLPCWTLKMLIQPTWMLFSCLVSRICHRLVTWFNYPQFRTDRMREAQKKWILNSIVIVLYIETPSTEPMSMRCVCVLFYFEVCYCVEHSLN